MAFFDGFSQAGSTHVGIDLGRRKIGMPEERLDGSQICSSLEQIRGKGVAQNVGRNPILGNARLTRQFLEQQKEVLPAHRPSPPAEKESSAAIRSLPQ